MNKDNAKDFEAPGLISDSLTELLRQGARGLIEKAVETELQFFLSQYEHVTDLKGRKTVVFWFCGADRLVPQSKGVDQVT